MSSAEGVQQQTWPDLDVSYFRWEPPNFQGIPATPEEGAKKDGRSSRVESAFAHSNFPTTFAGWDKVRAASEAEQKAADSLAGRSANSHRLSEEQQQQRQFAGTPPASLAEYHAGEHGTGHDSPASNAFQAQQNRTAIGGQGASSAFTSLRPGERQTAAPAMPGSRNLSWPAQHPQNAQYQPQPYGGSFDGLFSAQQPASLRFGFPDPGEMPRASSGGAASVGQSHLPVLLVRCGRFAAPVQREAGQQQQQTHHQFAPWAAHQTKQDNNYHGSSWSGQKAAEALQRSPTDPLQLQEYYAAQSDVLEELMKGRGVRDQHMLAAAVQGTMHNGDVESDFLDVLGGPLHLGRASSALEVPHVHQGTASHDMEPYMPQWQSESVPAELPNHVVNRLMMGGAAGLSNRNHRSSGLSGTKRDHSGLPSMPSIPDDQELPLAGLRNGLEPKVRGRKVHSDALESQNVDDLEELARTADVEVAHRAFLVPPHKKRGKGGRQPAADPRLDPSIDARRAKRILANRLSAARSKMKQKNQMESLAGLVQQLEEHKKQLREDAAELMEVCEKVEFENRRLLQQTQVLDEFGRRQVLQNARLIQEQSNLTADAASRQNSAQDEIPHAMETLSSDGRVDTSGGGANTESGNLMHSKSSEENLLRNLQAGSLSAGDALMEFARES